MQIQANQNHWRNKIEADEAQIAKLQQVADVNETEFKVGVRSFNTWAVPSGIDLGKYLGVDRDGVENFPSSSCKSFTRNRAA